MKVQFVCKSDEKPEFDRVFIIEWGANPIPRVGDDVYFQDMEFIEWLSEEEEMFYMERPYFLKHAPSWIYEPDEKSFIPSFFSNSQESS